MQLDRRLRDALYLVLGVLFVTGVAWYLLDMMRDPFAAAPAYNAGPLLLAVHGAAAMIFLLLLGALLPLHMRSNWASDRNRWTGIVMLGANGVLIVTAYALYYSGSDSVRGWASDVHLAAGLFLPAWVAVHVWLGRRARLASQRRAPDTAGK